MANAIRRRILRAFELVLLIAGLVLASIFVGYHLHRFVLSRAAVKHFKGVEARRAPQKMNGGFADKQFSFDFALWSRERIAAYEQSLAEQFDPPVAVLRISKVHLEVPVLAGTDDLTLNRGVGHIENTAPAGGPGNIGIAGHRDGFFRVLKDVGPGDMIELETRDRLDIYRIQQIVIVNKNDASVLEPTSISRLTLVTCYPFYFIGSAPKRYIVQASLAASGRPVATEALAKTSSTGFESASPKPNQQSQQPTKEITP